ncbi:MAG: AIPR family protein [Anaerolineales bacterium]
MSDLIIRRIKGFLIKEFEGFIDLSDIKTKSSEEQENYLLTRSLAACILAFMAEIDKKTAAQYVIDDYDDNGIDAIYYDEETNIVHVVQSKWVEAGVKSPDLGSLKKYVSGFKDYLGGKFDRFNKKLLKMRSTLERALDNTDVKFSLSVVYTGTQPLSAHGIREFDDLLEKENNPIEVVSYRIFSQKEVYDIISGSFGDESINIDITLRDWGYISEPYEAYYGQVSTEEIAKWYSEYGGRLTSRNIRNFKGDTDVNDAMKLTLTRDPGKFWYFNNGITILCKSIEKKRLGGADRDIGYFVGIGASVVNGAQTVGSIEYAVSKGFPKAKEGKVLVRFISLENCPPDFGIEVTTATNTQNRIERRDFASLDYNQERIRTEMSLDLNKIYAYKTGEKVHNYQDGCDIEEATIALACAYPKTQLAAGAKRNVGMLWGDITKPPYTLLFNNALTASRVWTCIKVARVVEDFLSKERETEDGYRRRIAVHGNRFILHRVFQMLPQEKFDDINFNIDTVVDEILNETQKILSKITEVIQNSYGTVYLNTFFKNASACEELSEHLPELPHTPKIPYFASANDETQQLELF